MFGGDNNNPPGNAPLGVFNPAPFINVAEFELTTLTSMARSTYYDTKTPDPSWLTPIVAPVVQPGGASLVLEFSGSMDGIVEDVPFTPFLQDIDGHQYVRFQATLRSNLFTITRARVAVLSLPFTFE